MFLRLLPSNHRRVHIRELDTYVSTLQWVAGQTVVLIVPIFPAALSVVFFNLDSPSVCRYARILVTIIASVTCNLIPSRAHIFKYLFFHPHFPLLSATTLSARCVY
ncbi:hypothetical protein F4777DRAFT_144422 [Nemania sp. FL0916]|nr:hypothetical protein F4777DRAFT_144422 [Nemania sp. FL0916]